MVWSGCSCSCVFLYCVCISIYIFFCGRGLCRASTGVAACRLPGWEVGVTISGRLCCPIQCRLAPFQAPCTFPSSSLVCVFVCCMYVYIVFIHLCMHVYVPISLSFLLLFSCSGSAPRRPLVLPFSSRGQHCVGSDDPLHTAACIFFLLWVLARVAL